MLEIDARAVVAISLALVFSADFAHAEETDVCVASAERAQVERKKGALIEARTDLVTCAREQCPLAVRNDCKRWLSEVDASMPSIVPALVDEHGHDIRDARVSLDGTPWLDHIDGRAVAVNPGDHVLRFEHSGGVVEEKIMVHEGERDRLVTGRVPVKVDLPREPTSSGVSPAVWILGGVAAVALGTGIGFWVSGRDARANLYDTCGKTSSCSSDDVDAAKRKIVIGDVFAGVAIAAVGAAVVVAIVVHPHDKSAVADALRAPSPWNNAGIAF